MAYAHDVVALGRGASQTGTADAHDAPGGLGSCHTGGSFHGKVVSGGDTCKARTS